MPGSVKSGVDGGYQFYKRSVDEIDEDYKRQIANHNSKEDVRVEKAAASNERDHLVREAEAARAINEVKKNTQEQMSRERAYNKAEVERIKNNTYDKFGRYQGNEADVTKQQLQSSKDAIEDLTRKYQASLTDRENYYQERLAKTQVDADGKTEEGIKRHRESLNESSDYAIEARRANEEADRYRSQRQYKLLDEQRINEVDQERKYNKKVLAENKDNYDKRYKEFTKDEEFRNEKIRDSFRLSAEKSINNQRNAHRAETNDLRSQVKDMTEAGMRDRQRLGDAVENYDREISRDNQRQLERIINDRDMTVEQMRKRYYDAEEHVQDNNREMIREKEGYYSNAIRTQTDEAYQREKDLQATFENSYNQLHKRNELDREQASEAQERIATRAAEDRDKALEGQARSYRESANTTKKSTDSQIQRLSNELQVRRTTADPTDISPAAEEAVRRRMGNEYEKTFAADRMRNALTIDGIQESYSNRMQDALSERESRETDRMRTATADHHRERADLLNTVQDSEAKHMAATRDIETQNDRERDKLTKNYSFMMERQRRQFENNLQQARFDGQNAVLNARREAEMNAKMAQRAAANRQTETIRTYERKLADQKIDFDSRIAETKAEAELALRNQEKSHKNQSEELVKNYEFRIAQLEAQSKERERMQLASFENQLERTQRTHEEQLKKQRSNA